MSVFTPEEVESLNAYQRAGVFHPFTCGGNRTDEAHLDGEGILLATVDGWVCPYCDYTQDWAHPEMTDGSWRNSGTLMAVQLMSTAKPEPTAENAFRPDPNPRIAFLQGCLAGSRKMIDDLEALQSLHLKALHAISAALGHPYAGDTAKTCLDLAELAVARIRQLEQDNDEQDQLRERLATILENTANALHGRPHKNGFWSWHDLAERATRLRAERDRLKRKRV